MSNFAQWLHISSISLRTTNCPSNWHDRGDDNYKFQGPQSGITEATAGTVVKFCRHVGRIKLAVLWWQPTL